MSGDRVRSICQSATCPQPIYVDRAWGRSWSNLLSNAFKFTFEGSVVVRLRLADSAATLEISDTGNRIPDRELPRLFERFHRIEGARSRGHEGSGIGLALVNELVRMHGGEIRVKSREGQGTTFLVSVPRGSAHLPADRVRKERLLLPIPAKAEAYVDEARSWISAP